MTTLDILATRTRDFQKVALDAFGRVPDDVEFGTGYTVAVYHLRDADDRIHDILKRSDPEATVGGPRTVKCVQYTSDDGWDVCRLALAL